MSISSCPSNASDTSSNLNDINDSFKAIKEEQESIGESDDSKDEIEINNNTDNKEINKIKDTERGIESVKRMRRDKESIVNSQKNLKIIKHESNKKIQNNSALLNNINNNDTNNNNQTNDN